MCSRSGVYIGKTRLLSKVADNSFGQSLLPRLTVRLKLFLRNGMSSLLVIRCSRTLGKCRRNCGKCGASYPSRNDGTECRCKTLSTTLVLSCCNLVLTSLQVLPMATVNCRFLVSNLML